MARRKELYEEKHPESRNGGDRRSISSKQVRTENPPERFAAATAAAIGKVERVVHLDVSRGTKIGEEALALVTRTPLDNARYLDTLKRVPKAEQVERVHRDLAEPPARTKPTPDAAYLAWIEEGQRWLNRGDADWQARARTTLFPAG